MQAEPLSELGRGQAFYLALTLQLTWEGKLFQSPEDSWLQRTPCELRVPEISGLS